MLALEHFIVPRGLAEVERVAIAKHWRVPDVVAVEFGDYLIQAEGGLPKIRLMPSSALTLPGSIATGHS